MGARPSVKTFAVTAWEQTPEPGPEDEASTPHVAAAGSLRAESPRAHQIDGCGVTLD